MAKRGVKPKKLTELKRFRPDKHTVRMPQPQGVPTRPENLKEEGYELWDYLVPKLVELNIATDVDQHQLVAMCEWWQEYRFWVGRGMNVEYTRPRALAYQQFMSLAAKFGTTPYDRRKLRPKEVKEQPTPMAEFLKRKGNLTG